MNTRKKSMSSKFAMSKLSSAIYYKHKNERAFKRDSNIDFVFSIVIILVAVLAFRLFIFEPIRVDGQSMEPTLHNNERMLVEKISYYFHAPERGDIVICYYPNRGDTTFVKRVVGLPGETIEVSDGAVYIDGELLDESAYWNDYIKYDYGPTLIPDDCVFVMGDNRNNSGDSRQGSVGPIPINRIIGCVRGVFWPFDQLRET